MVPVWFQKLSTLANHLVELPAPFLLPLAHLGRHDPGTASGQCVSVNGA